MALTFEEYVSGRRRNEQTAGAGKLSFDDYVKMTPQQTAPQNDALMDLAMETVKHTTPTPVLRDNHDRYHDAQKAGINTFRPAYGYGNIDLTDRPVYRNADGTISTVDSFSTNINGKEVLLPQIGRDANGNAVRWTQDQAIDNYLKTGENLGTFKTVEDANNYADWLHNQQENYYSTPSLMERIKETVKSGGLSRVSGDVNTAGVFMDNRGGTVATEMYEEELSDIQKRRGYLADEMQRDPEYANDPEAIWQLAQYDSKIEQLETAIRANKGTAPELFKIADELGSEAAKSETRAKQGLGWLGQQMVNAGSSGVNMMIDRAETMLAPGLGLTSLGVRAFGNSAQEARQEGANSRQQMLYGLANAATEVGSELLGDIPGRYGGGLLDEAVEGVIKRIAKTPAVETLAKLVASTVGESLEELVAGAIEPGLKSIYDNEGFFSKEHYNKETLIDTAEAMFVGGFLGALGGGTQVGIEAVQNIPRARLNKAVDNAYKTMEQNGMFSPEAAEANQKARKEINRSGSFVAPVEQTETDAAAEATKAAPLSDAAILNLALSEDSRLTDEGKAVAREMYNITRGEDTAPLDFIAGFNDVYDAARRGESPDSIQSEAAARLTPQARAAAYDAGLEAMRADTAERYSYSVRENDGEYTVVIHDAETGRDNPMQSVSTREEAEEIVKNFKGVTESVESGSQGEIRDAGVSGREGRGGLRERAEKNRAWRETRKRDAEGIRNRIEVAGDGEKVSAREAGISGGTDAKTMSIVRTYRDADMRKMESEAAAHGVKVVFFSGEIEARKGGKTIKARGEYSADGKTFYVAVDDPDFTARQIFDHEDFHARAHTDAELQQICEDIINGHSAAELQKLVNAYVNTYGWTSMSDEDILQEILADAYAGIDVFQYLYSFEGATLFTEDVRGAVKARESEQRTERGPPAGAKLSQKMESEENVAKLTPANVDNTTLPPNVEVLFSQKYDAEYMRNAEDFNKKSRAVPESVLRNARKAREIAKQKLDAIKDMLPPDIEGNTWYDDSSYGGTQENTTICPRSLALEELMDAVAEELGRPLTVEDTVFIAQEAMAYTDKPECLYCYVAMDRKAYRDALGKYIDQRDAFLKDVADGMEIGLVAPTAKGAGSRKVSKDSAYGRFLNGRANTENMYKRAQLWLNTENAITKQDVASATRMNAALNDPALREQILDVMDYAQKATWAKKKVGYTAYDNGILKWSDERVRDLNRMYGMRMYSFSDFSPAFILENMQMITDASVRGLKALGYTKELDFVKIFAPSGININVSVFGYNDWKTGEIAMDAMQGADWNEAKALRAQYPNVGCTFVATNDAQVEWALAQDWIDVVIPYHIVRTGANVAKMFGWENYQRMQEDKKNPDWTAGDSTHIYPYQHQNNKATYLRLCKQNHLTPRFSKWVDNPNYMKLVNETRQSDKQTKPVKPIFDTEFIDASIDEMVKRGGYVQHIGGTVENMQDIASETAEKIRSGKSAIRTEAKLSQKITPQQDAEYSAAVERGDERTARRMVADAAKEWGAVTNEKGKPIVLYHGTPRFGFTRFGTDAIFTTPDAGVAAGYGSRGYADPRKISEVYTPDDGTDETLIRNVKNVLHKNARTITDADIEDVKARFAKEADKINDVTNEAWNYGDNFPEMPYEIDNGLSWMLTLPGEVLENVGEILEGGVYADELTDTIRHFNANRDDVRNWFSEHRKEIIDAGNENLYRLVTGYDLTDFAIDVEYSLLRAANRDENLIWDNGKFVSKDALRDQVEQYRELGAYSLYGNLGDNPLIIDAKGAFWASVAAPELGEVTMLTDNIVTKAQQAGYTALVIKNVLDPAMNNYSPNRPADDYIFFSPDQVKSADPVTYDDNCNVIPLSERFNPEKQDIRFSQKLTAEDELRQQNDELQKLVEYWRGQTKRTTAPTVRADDAEKVARDFVKSYNSKLDVKDAAAAVKALAEYIQSDNVTWAEVKDRAYGIARDVVENAEALREGDGATYDEIKTALRKPLIISAQDAHDVSPEWSVWRNANLSKVNVSINGKGTPVDVAYAELSERFPSLFPESITHPADQVQQMVDVVNELAPVYENPFSYNMAEAIEYCANDLISRVYGENIRMAPPTFADRAAARLEAEKARGAEKTARVREQKNAEIADLKARNAWATAQRIAEVRKQRDAKIAALKEHYAESRKAASERRADSAARTRLLKIIRRLNNKKLPAVNRAWLEEKIGDLDTVAKSITGETIKDLTRLRSWYDNQKANNPDFIADAATEAKIARLSQTRISDLTLSQVQELTEVLLNFENEIANQRKLIDSLDMRDTRQMVLESLYNVEETKGSQKTAADWIVTNTLSPGRLVKRLTGYAETDPLLMRTRDLADGQRRMFDYQRRAEKKFSRWANDKKLMERLRSKERIKITGYSHGRAVEAEITPDMRMALYLHSLNDENMKHIANGGVTIPDIGIYLKGDIGDAYDRGKTLKLSPSNVRSIAAGMSAEERAFARAAHDYFNGMSRDEINAVSEKLVGYSIAGVEDYFPIETDKNFTNTDIAELKRDGTIEGMGFLKERKPASNAIYLVPLTDVLNKSIQNHAKYVGMAIPVRNFSKLWGMNVHNDAAGEDNGLRQAIGHKWGDRGIKAIERIISDVQNPSRSEDGKLLASIRSNYAAAVLTLNASVALKQAASYPTAAAVLGWEPLLKAMGNVGSVNLDLIDKYTPLQWYRSKGFSTQELGDIRNKGGVMDKVLSASIKTKDGREIPLLNWIQGIDLATTRKLWKASEYYVQQHNADLERGSDAYYKAVADIYNRVIEETQPNYTTMQRPQILRSSNQLLQSLVMFKTQPFQNFNILYDAIGELRAAERAAKNGDKSRLTQAKKNAVNAISSNLVSAVVFAAMTMAWAYARRKKDKYEDKEGNFSPWKQLGKDVLSSEFGMIPFGTDAYNLFSSWVLGEKYYGMSNITAESISGALDATKKAVDTLSGVVTALLDGDDATNAEPETVAKELFDCAKDLSKIAGLPLENVVNLMTAVYTNVADAVNGEYVTGYELLRSTKNMESSYNKSAAYDMLYKAKNQDMEQYNELRRMMIKDGFKEKNIDEAMKKRAENK